MSKLNVSQEKINGAAATLFVVSIAILHSIGYPNMGAGILLSSGLAILVRQFLHSRLLDMIVASLIFGGSWLSVHYRLYPHDLVPLLVSIGALYYIGVQVATAIAKQQTIDEEL